MLLKLLNYEIHYYRIHYYQLTKFLFELYICLKMRIHIYTYSQTDLDLWILLIGTLYANKEISHLRVLLFQLFVYTFVIGTTARDETTTMKQPITKTSTTENDPMTTTRTYPDENTGRTETQKSTTEKSTTLSSINTQPSKPTPKETPEPEVSTQTTEETITEFGNFTYIILHYCYLWSTSRIVNLEYSC